MRRSLIAVVGLGLALALAGPAAAAGVGGVSMTPDKGPTDPSPGQATAFHVLVPQRGTTTTGFTLTNVVDEERTVRLYAAGTEGTPGSGISVTGSGDARWIQLDDGEISLQPGEERRFEVTVADPGAAVDELVYGAIVLEIGSDIVIARAATLVYATVGEPRSGLPGGLPAWLAVAAVLLVAAASAGQWWRWRRASSVDRRAQAASRAA